MAEKEALTCEVSRSAGYDPTGEYAVECGAEGAYCEECEMVVCDYCHRRIAEHGIASDRAKKNPARAGADRDRRRTA